MKGTLLQHIRSAAVPAMLLAASVAMLGGCGSSASDAPEVNLEFDFETGEYSFTGVDDAAEYRVRIFPVTDGEEEELPINESQAIRGGEDEYSGSVALWSLTPGETYNVYVMVTDEEGDNTMSEALSGIYIAIYDVIDDGVTATIQDDVITVSLDSSVLENNYGTGAAYDITLYTDGAVVETTTLAESDIVEEVDESSWFASTTYVGSVTFDGADADADNTVTVTVTATSDVYISSEESEAFEVTEYVEETAADAVEEEAGDGFPE